MRTLSVAVLFVWGAGCQRTGSGGPSRPDASATDSGASADTATVDTAVAADMSETPSEVRPPDLGNCELGEFVVAALGTKPVVTNVTKFDPRCLKVKPGTTVIFKGSVPNMPTTGYDGDPFGYYLVGDGATAEIYVASPAVYRYRSKADAAMKGVVWVAE